MSATFSDIQRIALTAFVMFNLPLNLACLIPVPRAQVVANCEIRGEIKMIDSNEPAENVMIFALYSFKGDEAKSKKPISVGPILSDSKGQFSIPRYFRKHWYLEHLYMGDCGGSLLFIHPRLGAYSVLICTEDFSPGLEFKELKVVQHTMDEKWTKERIKYTYTAITQLPNDLQSKAWAHVDPEMRPNKYGSQ